ncbi:MAG: type VI secretion system baseplate subunit TssF [Gemmataceae bacterium]
MSEDPLLAFYNRELAYARKQAGQFAQAHPKIAARLRLGADATEDPHVERLIEAFAYLTARTRLKLDDDFPELTEALLGVLYPHYQAPIPSMAVVEFELDPGQPELGGGHTLPAHTSLETETVQGAPCRFRTCYPVTLWPFDLTIARLARVPYAAPAPPTGKVAGVVHLSLTGRSKKLTFADLKPDSLRFYLRGQPQHTYPLYELLFNNVISVALANGPDDRDPVWLDPDCIQPVGFERDDGLLPYPRRSFLGYRLLTEFFVFPEKFRFFELTQLGAKNLAKIGGRLDVFVYLNRSAPDLEANVSEETFRPGCSPVVNLFPRRADPVALTQTDYEYRVAPDSRRPLNYEIYSIDRVTATSGAGEARDFYPFFSVQHGRDANAGATYWYPSRRAADQAEGVIDHGTEVFLTLVDLDFQPAEPADKSLAVETTCLNRDLPGRLPFGGGQPRLSITDGDPLVTQVNCLTAPTRTLRPALRQGTLWKLISHLSLNHLSLVDGADGPDALREILKLYDFSDSAETRAIIDGVLGVQGKNVTGRLGGKGGGVCRGVEATVQFDADRFTGSGLFLFAAVLERFLALYSHVNSFSRLTATVRGREGVLRRWPPRLGEKVLL